MVKATFNASNYTVETLNLAIDILERREHDYYKRKKCIKSLKSMKETIELKMKEKNNEIS